MNEHDESDATPPALPLQPPPAPPVFPPPPPPPLPRRPLSYWLRRCLACNPFYLVSAALLLYGLYRVSVDPNFLATESAQLFFNFTSLQLYEVLLVGTAIVLAGPA